MRCKWMFKQWSRYTYSSFNYIFCDILNESLKVTSSLLVLIPLKITEHFCILWLIWTTHTKNMIKEHTIMYLSHSRFVTVTRVAVFLYYCRSFEKNHTNKTIILGQQRRWDFFGWFVVSFYFDRTTFFLHKKNYFRRFYN